MLEWIGVDLDGTLAEEDGGFDLAYIGEPVPAMLKKVKQLIREGKRVKIFTARVGVGNEEVDMAYIKSVIWDWLEKQCLPRLEITCKKDYGMKMLYDDRCVQVERNTGRLIE